MPKATEVYIVDPETQEVLLAKKRCKIAIGKWFGYGGKFKPEDCNDPIRCLLREVVEESNGVLQLDPFRLELVAVINFYNGFWSIFRKPFKVLCYRALQSIEQLPPTTDEMETPSRFSLTKLPLDEFKIGDELFVPQIICGIPIRGYQWFTKNEKRVIRSRIVSCTRETLQRLAV